MGKNFSCNNTGKRKASDFYETPYCLTRELLRIENLYGNILEPACGNGAITKVLKEFDYNVESYDIEKDFFTEDRKFDFIITNPPFSKSMEFIKKCKEVSKRFFLLLPLSYLHGKKRYDEVYQDISFPLSKVYIFTRYPMLGEKLNENGMINTGMMVYAWFKWDIAHSGNPMIDWIDIDKFIIKKT